MGDNIRIISAPAESGFSLSDVVAILALIASLYSLWSTHRSIFASKKIDVKFTKFDKMCLQSVDKIFASIDKIFIDEADEELGNFKSKFTDITTELNIFFAGIKGVYSDLDINALGIILDTFTDNAYQQPNTTPISALKGSYYSTKTQLYQFLFDYSISNDLDKLKTKNK